jgi:tricorn protease-like protein
MRRLGWAPWGVVLCAVALCGAASGAWGAVGDGIVYTSSGSIYYLGDGVRMKVERGTTGLAYAPSWSPDGSAIAFRAESQAPSGEYSKSVWSVDIATEAVTQVTDYDADDYEPTWSPDGSQRGVSSIRCKRPSHVTGILSPNMMANRGCQVFGVNDLLT